MRDGVRPKNIEVAGVGICTQLPLLIYKHWGHLHSNAIRVTSVLAISKWQRDLKRYRRECINEISRLTIVALRVRTNIEIEKCQKTYEAGVEPPFSSFFLGKDFALEVLEREKPFACFGLSLFFFVSFHNFQFQTHPNFQE